MSEAEAASLADVDGDLTKVDQHLRERVENAEEATALRRLYQEAHHAE